MADLQFMLKYIKRYEGRIRSLSNALQCFLDHHGVDPNTDFQKSFTLIQTLLHSV